METEHLGRTKPPQPFMLDLRGCMDAEEKYGIFEDKFYKAL